MGGAEGGASWEQKSGCIIVLANLIEKSRMRGWGCGSRRAGVAMWMGPQGRPGWERGSYMDAH